MKLLPYLAFILTFTCLVNCNWKQHYRYQRKNLSRNRRQLDSGPTQVDLNITVPFIFSARLYPYGEDKGDHLLDPKKHSQRVDLKHDFIFYGQNYSTIYVSKDGMIGFDSGTDVADRQAYPSGFKSIAVYWTTVSLEDNGRVYYRESQEDNILQLAGSEVQIQYHNVNDLRPKSVFIVTWENVSSPLTPKGIANNPKNVFQAAFIISENGTYAHFVYSKLKWHNDAVAGFNDGHNKKLFYNLPGSNSANVMKLANESDIGIPGEWLFKLDDTAIHLCGPGFKGLECVDRCQKFEYSNDCSRRCHCDNNEPCNLLTGHCPKSKCANGWQNPPVCDADEDECLNAKSSQLCSGVQPDCVNTPGSYACTCLSGFDNATNTCFGHARANISLPVSQRISQIFTPTNAPTNAPFIIVPNFAGGPSGLPQVRPSLPLAALSSTSAPPVPLTSAPPVPLTSAPSAPLTSASARTIGVNVSQTFFRPTVNGSIAQLQTLTTSLPTHNETNDSREEFVAIIPQELIPETLKPVLPPGIPFFTTKSVTTSSKPELCDLQCFENSHCEFQHGGNMKCICNRGWTGDGSFCTDINECFLDNACEPNAKCQNTIGSYNCLCEPGFRSDGKNCVDSNECLEEAVQCPGGNTSQCVNTPGSYSCQCKNGYNGNPNSVLGCIDINECLIPEFYCGPNAECENLPGNFQCHCHSGYQRNADATDCEDINECKTSPCSGSAVCRNSPGSFSCSCLDGYSGDGFICQETILYPFSRTEDKRLPQERNAVAEVPLPFPVKLLGKEFSHFFVSANGIVTFDRSMEIYSDLPVGEMRRLGLAPLYQKVDLTRGGGVYTKVTTEYLSLARATNSVHDDFHESDFKAKIVIVITFDDVIQLKQEDDTKRSTFQIVIAAGDEGTYVTYIYDRISNDKAQVAIVAPEPPRSVVAPLSGINATMMKETSNINIDGKWMFRVDERLVLQCPAGFLGPPYCLVDCEPGTWGQACAKPCQCTDSIPCDFKSGYCSNHACLQGFTGENCHEDIDECAIPQRLCHQRASCINTIGSFKCKCDLGWTGDGFHCVEITPCLLNAGLICGENAGCFVPSNGSEPKCICNVGYHGDGHLCSAKAVTPTIAVVNVTSSYNATSVTHNSTTNTALPVTWSWSTHNLDNSTNDTSLFGNHSFNVTSSTTLATSPIITTLLESEPKSVAYSKPAPEPEPEPHATNKTEKYSVFITTKPTSSIAAAKITLPTTQLPAQTPSTAIENENNNHQSSNSKFQTGQLNRKSGLDSGSPTQILIIVIPAVLCGVWLILIIVLLVVCVRRKRQKQNDRYGNSYYLPSSNGAPNSSPVNTNYSIYGSQWSVPRPIYDYYKGYYPDYYSAYKY